MLQSWLERARMLSERYGVDPVVFAVIYLGAIPFFWLGTLWMVAAAPRRRSLIWPALFTGLCFVSPYLYVLLFGRGLPWWSYALIGALLAGFGWQSWRSLRRRLGQSRSAPSDATPSDGLPPAREVDR